jgi:hypothetical protein
VNSTAHLGPASPNDVDTILAVANTDITEVAHTVADHADAAFTWNYRKGERPRLARLYEKAKGAQWNAETDLAWDTDVDQEAILRATPSMPLFGPEVDMARTPFAGWGDKEWLQFGIESQNWTMSQSLHGEQGALLCTAKIVETVPWFDAKYYAATQVMDEARHVEAFSKYLTTKLSGQYPVNAHLRTLLDDILADSRWDLAYLGMQIIVEGLALAAFSYLHDTTPEPLLRQLLRYVMSDEARHVAFGVITLQEFYEQLTAAEIRERQEFAFAAALHMRDRFLQQEVWERMGLSVRDIVRLLVDSPQRLEMQSSLFAKLVPNCKKLGLLDAGDGWLRQRFGEIGVLRFEHLADTADDYDTFQIESPVA